MRRRRPCPQPSPSRARAPCTACLFAATLPVSRTLRYIYSDTVVKPRWQLIMHQLSQATRLPPLRTPARTGATRRTPPPPHTAAPQHALACGTALRPLLTRAETSGAVRPHPNQRVAPRRIIVELHSEWGLPTSFFADVAQVRVGVRVRLRLRVRVRVRVRVRIRVS